MSDLSTFVFSQAPPVPKHLNVLAYGPSGCGKSTLAATAPGPILWLNAEGGNALAFARMTAAKRGTEIREVLIPHGVDPRNALRDTVKYLRSDEGADVQTVVIDTMGKIRDGLAQSIGGKQPTLQQWGDIGKVLTETTRLLRDMPVNFVVIAHEEIKDGDDGGDRIIRPQIGGATTEKVVADMDVVAYLGVRRTESGVEYLAQFVESRGRRAKDRSGGLGVSRPCDLSEWIAAYRAALMPADEPDVPFTDSGEPRTDPVTFDDVLTAGEAA
jgi:hypothetical protein